MTKDLAEARNVENVSPPTPNEAGDTALITVILSTSPQDERTPKVIGDLRENVVPQATKGSDATVYVGGPAAAFVDINGRIFHRMPLFFS